MKRILLSAILFAATLPSLGESVARGKGGVPDVGKRIIVKTPPASTGVTLEGLGVEMDPHFLSQNVTGQDGATAEDWENIVVRRAGMMKLQRFRVMVMPYWWEPERGVFTFDSLEMKSLYAVLDLADKIGADVTLVLWGCPAACRYVDGSARPSQWQRHYLSDPAGTNWVTAPSDPDEFAACFSALVRYLIENKGYKCIREVTPFNEPDGDVCDPDTYFKVVKAMDRKFREDGIRDKVRFNLSDNTDTRRFFLEACAGNLAGEADMFNSHTYIFGYETLNSEVKEWEKANVAAVASTGKKHFVGEFGSNLCTNASRQKDINRYERGVLLVRNCLNFLNAGACGASYWSLIDQYYSIYDSYETMQQLGLWRYKKSVYKGDDAEGCGFDYQVRPQYYAWSLMTRFVRKGDTVRPLDLSNEMAAGSAFLSEDGKWTYVFANGYDEDITVDLVNANGKVRYGLDIYRYTRDAVPGPGDDDDSMLEPSGRIRFRGGKCRVCIPASSVALLTQRSYSE